MVQALAESSTLHNGVKMPWLGLGVWKVDNGNEVVQAVRTALDTGYRHIDTAAAYGNEEGVGQAIRESGIRRDELFVTTKLANEIQEMGYEASLRAYDESLKRLGLEYADLYLVHWPVEGHYTDAWRALVKLYKDGRVRSIGVSNFTVDHLERIIAETGEVPAVNQVEHHPLLTRRKLHAYCREKRIQMEAYSPLMQGNLDLPVLQELARAYGKTPAQIILRWNIQNEVVTIPKSVHKNRIEENAAIFDFRLSAADMERIAGLNRDHRFLNWVTPKIVTSPE